MTKRGKKYTVTSGEQTVKCSAGALGYARARRFAEDLSRQNRHATIWCGEALVARYYEGRRDT